MQRLIREAMYDGALGFLDGAEGPRRAAGHCDDDERWALASVLGELGTGVFQVAGGAPGGTKQTRAVAREVAARTRPAVDLQPHVRSDRQSPGRGRAPEVSRGRVQERRAATARPCRPSPARSSTSSEASTSRRTRTSPTRKASSAACRLGTGSWPCPIKTGCVPSATSKSARQCPPRRLEHRRAGRRGDRSARPHARPVQSALGPRQGVHDRQGQNRHLSGKSVEQIAKEQNKGIMDAFLDLSLDLRICRPVSR